MFHPKKGICHELFVFFSENFSYKTNNGSEISVNIINGTSSDSYAPWIAGKEDRMIISCGSIMVTTANICTTLLFVIYIIGRCGTWLSLISQVMADLTINKQLLKTQQSIGYSSLPSSGYKKPNILLFLTDDQDIELGEFLIFILKAASYLIVWQHVQLKFTDILRNNI